MKNTLKSGITCRFVKKQQYILQYCGGGHLGFIKEQYLKIECIRNDLLIQKSHKIGFTHLFVTENKKYIFSKMAVAAI